jgi:RNA-directed DNA polymerase
MRKRGTQKHYVYTIPSKKAVASIRQKVRAKTSRSTLHMSLDEVLKSLNWAVRGWANYFRHAVAKRLFGHLDSHAWRRIVTWIRRKHNRISWKELRRRFCDRGWRIAHNGVVFTGASSVAVTRYRYRGHNIHTPWAPTPAAVAG